MSETDQNIGKLLAYAEEQKANSVRMEKKLNEMDSRLRTVERNAARNGLVSGGLISVAISTIGYMVKSNVGSP